jgi:hypothetical protein
MAGAGTNGDHGARELSPRPELRTILGPRMGGQTGVRFWVLAAIGLSGSIAGCTGTAPPKDIPAPDISKLTVFFPVEGRVYGRGDSDAIADPTVTHVVISAHPTGTETILELEEDKSFTFSIIASTLDILEIVGTRDETGRERGDPAYVRVPILPPPKPRWVCCGEPQGTCTPQEIVEAGMACLDRLAGAEQCASILDCRKKNDEILPLDLTKITVTPPDPDGRISVSGTVGTGRALVRLENRGKRGVGSGVSMGRFAQVSDSNGFFRFKSLPARGDDELVVQVQDLRDFRSPQGSMIVPDSPLAAFDITGAYPFERLDNGKIGTVAIRFHPSGVDGYGMCPNSTSDPILCFTGGLAHEMVVIDNATFDGTYPVNPIPSTRFTPNRGTEGDPLGPSRNIVLVLDMSTNANVNDAMPPFRFAAAQQFVKSLRKRDRVGIVSYGGNVVTELPITGSDGNWAAQLGALGAMSTRPPAGDPFVFQGIQRAATMLTDLDDIHANGTIVVIGTGDAAGDTTDDRAQCPATGQKPPCCLCSTENPCCSFETALEGVAPNRDAGRKGYSVYYIGVNVPEPQLMNNELIGSIRLMESIAGFSPGGRFTNLISPAGLTESLGDAAGYLAGSYVLLYDMDIPEQVGKAARFDVSATITVTGVAGFESASGRYEGTIRVDGSER